VEEIFVARSKVFKKQATSLLSREDLIEFISEDLAQLCATDLNRIVFSPLQKFTTNNSNLFRARLVELSISLCSDKSLVFTKQFQKEISQKLSKFLEALHAGSLIIDDIQDGAQTRRGKTSLHQDIGVPLAINSGSWLYFWALSMLSKMELEPRLELEMTRLCHQTMIKGHLGQALDLGVCIDQVSQAKAKELSSTAMKLKTGTLMSLASELGAVVCGVHSEVRLALKNFGLDFGYALQSFNDLKEFSESSTSINQDLIHGRPTWIWVCASEFLTQVEYADFVQQVSSLRTSETASQQKIMLQLKKHPLVGYARSEAKKLMTQSYQKLSDHLMKFDYELNQRSDWKELQLLGKKVMETYV
jgi:geranylgeranyl pyrophosphate synthase